MVWMSSSCWLTRGLKSTFNCLVSSSCWLTRGLKGTFNCLGEFILLTDTGAERYVQLPVWVHLVDWHGDWKVRSIAWVSSSCWLTRGLKGTFNCLGEFILLTHTGTERYVQLPGWVHLVGSHGELLTDTGTKRYVQLPGWVHLVDSHGDWKVRSIAWVSSSCWLTRGLKGTFNCLGEFILLAHTGNERYVQLPGWVHLVDSHGDWKVRSIAWVSSFVDSQGF